MEIVNVPIKKIKLGSNSRLDVKTEELAELMSSIKENGLLQPIGLSPDYEVIYGNRRFLACSKLGMHSISAIIREHKDNTDFIVENLTENIQRKNVSMIEVGRYCSLLREQGLSIDEMVVRLGTNKNYLTNCLEAFGRVPEQFRSAIRESKGGKAQKIAGSLTNRDVTAIVYAQKRFNLDHAITTKLYSAAKSDPSFNASQTMEYAAALKDGKDISSVRPLKHIGVHVTFFEDDYRQLVAQYIENGPFSTMTSLLMSVLKGEKSIRLPVIASNLKKQGHPDTRRR